MFNLNHTGCLLYKTGAPPIAVQPAILVAEEPESRGAHPTVVASEVKRAKRLETGTSGGLRGQLRAAGIVPDSDGICGLWRVISCDIYVDEGKKN